MTGDINEAYSEISQDTNDLNIGITDFFTHPFLGNVYPFHSKASLA